MVIASDEQRRAPDALSTCAQQHGATCLNCTPTTARLLLAAGVPLPYKMLLIGEPLPLEVVRALFAAGARMVWNAYGPTEATVAATHRLFRSAADALGDGTASIGWPLPGYGVLLVDAQLRPQPPGAVGEIVLCGPIVADGYLGAASAEGPFGRGVFDAYLDGATPEQRQIIARSYRTGDMARVEPDGSLTYLGRRDAQVCAVLCHVCRKLTRCCGDDR
jgi:non-ribosomal peptide synthetase component F